MISTAHAFDPGAQYCDMRGKYDRTNAQKTLDWKTTAANHYAKVRSASLLGEQRCGEKCPHHKQCMSSAFTVYTLRNCAAKVFGDSILVKGEPSIQKMAAKHVWFDLIFQCRVVNFDGVVEGIEYCVDGRRVCGAAFAAVYAIPPATFETLARN
eukprot:3575760-Pleurochrysis_carterae.AAC.1